MSQQTKLKCVIQHSVLFNHVYHLYSFIQPYQYFYRFERGLEPKMPKLPTVSLWKPKSLCSAWEADDPTTSAATLRHLASAIPLQLTNQQQTKLQDSAANVNVSQEVQALKSSSGERTRITDEETKHVISHKAQHKQAFAKAPRIEFGADLVDWDNPTPSVATVQKRADLEVFWTGPEKEEHVSEELLAMVRTRTIPFIGQFEPVKRACWAPLPSGKLCPRKDRSVCPFHGPIIPRDNMGQPATEEDRLQLEQIAEKKRQAKTPDWQDPDLLKDIEAATSLNLKLPTKKGKGKGQGKKSNQSNLTNLKEKADTARSRLKKKVLSKSAIKRVANDLNNLEYKRFRDKFSNQFNYSME